MLDRDDRPGVCKGERPQKHGVHHTENRGISADAQGEDGESGQSKAWIFSKNAKRVGDG